MSDDLISIHKELSRLNHKLGEAIEQYGEASQKAAELRSEYDILYADCILTAPDEATLKIKDALAVKACAQEMTQARIAEAKVDYLSKRIRAIETAISSTQSRLRH